MNEQIFWNIIEDAKIVSGNKSSIQIELITRNLSQFDTVIIFKFEQIFHWLINKSYDAELWAAAAILNDGCSSQDFFNFRCWLILQGQAIFKQSLTDPETLTQFIPIYTTSTSPLIHTRILAHVAEKAYQLKTNLTDYYNHYPFTDKTIELKGDMWKNKSDLIDRLPLLCHAMGWGNEVVNGDWVSDSF